MKQQRATEKAKQAAVLDPEEAELAAVVQVMGVQQGGEVYINIV